MARGRVLPATAALVVAAGLTLGAAGVLDMLERPLRDVLDLRRSVLECPATDPLCAESTEAVLAPGPTRAPTHGRASGPASVGPHARLRSAPAPRWLHIERLGVSTTVVPVGVTADGGMEIPADVTIVGWYEARDRRVSPGDPGTAVIAGHRDSRTQGPGTFHDLADLRHGDRIAVLHTDGHVSTWWVDEVLVTPRDRLPTDLLFAREGEPRLALVTCGGTFDTGTGSYTHNIIVVASMDGPAGR